MDQRFKTIIIAIVAVTLLIAIAALGSAMLATKKLRYIERFFPDYAGESEITSGRVPTGDEVKKAFGFLGRSSAELRQENGIKTIALKGKWIYEEKSNSMYLAESDDRTVSIGIPETTKITVFEMNATTKKTAARIVSVADFKTDTMSAYYVQFEFAVDNVLGGVARAKAIIVLPKGK